MTWGYPATQLEQLQLQPIQARILAVLERDEVRGSIDLAEDVGLTEPELLRLLDTIPEVAWAPQERVGDQEPGCPLAWLRSAVAP